MKRKKILFVCTGNTCRSPMAEYVLRQTLKNRKIKWWGVWSRGISAEVGGEMSQNSQIMLDELGIEHSKFKPKQLSQKAIDDSDIVICMTEMQKFLLQECGNVKCIKDFCGFDVPDPYGQGVDVYRITRNAIIKACDAIIENYILKNQE